MIDLNNIGLDSDQAAAVDAAIEEWKSKYDELKAENEALKVIRDSSQENYDELLREHAALKEKADKYEKALKRIAEQKTCQEQKDDPEAYEDSEGSKLGDIETGYDCCIGEARTALSTYSYKEDQPCPSHHNQSGN